MRTSLACFLLLLFASCAVAQTDRNPLEIGGVTFSGNIRERYEAWDWFEPASGQNLYSYSGTLMRFSLSQQNLGYDWNIELAVPVMLDIPKRAVLPAPQGQLGLGAAYYVANNNSQYAAMIFPKQAFVRFKWDHTSLRIGRFEFADGSEGKAKDATLASLKTDRIGQRLLGAFGFSDVMRSFDGLHYAYFHGSWNLTAVSAIPTRGVFQVDGWGWVKTPITYVALTKEADLGNSHAEWRVFGLYYHDDRGVLKTDNRAAALRAADHQAINIGTYGGHFIMATPTNAGTFDLLGWGALQNGSWGTLTHRAGAGAIEAGYQPKFGEPVRPWFRGGYYYASGDGNATDNTHGTFFAVLPTPRVYARFPFFNSMNNTDAFGEVVLRPVKDLGVRADVHGLWLSSKADLWYAGGGAFQPGTFGFSGRPANGNTGLATLYDISSDYQCRYGISIGLYFGYAHGGPVIKSIYPANSNGALGFTELTYRF